MPTQPSHTKTNFKWHCAKALIGEEGAKSIVENCFSVSTFGAGGTNCKAVKSSRAITRNPGVQTQTTFELLMQKHDRAYFACEFRSM